MIYAKVANNFNLEENGFVYKNNDYQKEEKDITIGIIYMYGCDGYFFYVWKKGSKKNCYSYNIVSKYVDKDWIVKEEIV